MTDGSRLVFTDVSVDFNAARNPAALASVSSYSAAGFESATMPAPTLKCILSRRANRRADGDAQLAFAVETQIADRAAVRPARNRFQFVNDFHRAEFWRAGDAAAGKTRRERGEMRHVLPQPAFNGGNQMLHLREFFQPGQFRHLHGAEFANSAQIVAQQIGDHHQFGHFLGAGLQFVGQLRVAVGSASRGRVPLMGRVTMCEPLMRRNCSGDDETIWKSPQSRYAENGAGETAVNLLKKFPAGQVAWRRQAVAKG